MFLSFGFCLVILMLLFWSLAPSFASLGLEQGVHPWPPPSWQDALIKLQFRVQQEPERSFPAILGCSLSHSGSWKVPWYIFWLCFFLPQGQRADLNALYLLLCPREFSKILTPLSYYSLKQLAQSTASNEEHWPCHQTQVGWNPDSATW